MQSRLLESTELMLFLVLQNIMNSSSDGAVKYMINPEVVEPKSHKSNAHLIPNQAIDVAIKDPAFDLRFVTLITELLLIIKRLTELLFFYMSQRIQLISTHSICYRHKESHLPKDKLAIRAAIIQDIRELETIFSDCTNKPQVA